MSEEKPIYITMNKYLKETPMLDFSNESIQRLIEKQKWRELDDFERVRSIYNFVRDECPRNQRKIE